MLPVMRSPLFFALLLLLLFVTGAFSVAPRAPLAPRTSSVPPVCVYYCPTNVRNIPEA
jgi:hypothetical protein